MQIERLKRQKEVLETLSEDLSQQYQTEKLKTHTRVSNIEIIEKAVVPGKRHPQSDNTKKALMGLLVGLVVGVGVAFVLHQWDNTINSTLEIKRYLHLISLGLIPKMSDKDKIINPLKAETSLADLYSVLRNNIRYSHADNPQKCLLLASAIQGEGKTVTTLNLAISYATEGNLTLLLNADLRKRHEYALLRVGQKPRDHNLGLSDLLAGEAIYEDIILETDVSNLFVTTTGKKRQNPGKLLGSQNFKEFILDMEKQFDVIIIDAPAVLPVVDTTIISPLARAVLLVVGAGTTPIESSRQAITRLEHVQSNLVGAVLNRARHMRFDYFYGYGVSDYSKGYGYKTEPEPSDTT